jgi:hypothetical protein
LLNEFDDIDWIYRRNPDVRLPRKKFVSGAGKPLPLEVLLLYKAKHIRSVDEQDFNTTFSLLQNDQRLWLHNAISKESENHSWLNKML